MRKLSFLNETLRLFVSSWTEVEQDIENWGVRKTFAAAPLFQFAPPLNFVPPSSWSRTPEKRAWAYPGTVPIISGTGKATNFKFGRCIHSVHANKGSLKIGRKRAWVYPGTAEIFSVPPIISGTGKATNFQFCTHILSIDRNKSPLQISGKVAVC